MTDLLRVIGVIDDDPSVGNALRRLFRTAGFEVSLFVSAEDYLADPDRDDIGCLVVDVHLPEMSGLGGGGQGVLETFPLPLNEKETATLRASAAVIRKALDELGEA